MGINVIRQAASSAGSDRPRNGAGDSKRNGLRPSHPGPNLNKVATHYRSDPTRRMIPGARTTASYAPQRVQCGMPIAPVGQRAYFGV